MFAIAVLTFGGAFTRTPQVEVVTVGQMYPSQAITLLNASGYVVPQRKAAVASKLTGRLVSLSVEEGSSVRMGEVIARLENDDVAAAVKQASANIEVAKASLSQAKAELADASLSLEREKKLFEKDFTPKASYDVADARYKKALAAVAGAEAAVKAATAGLEAATVAYDYTLIRAPFNARVLTKNADIGDIVTPIGAAANAKAAVVTIADMDSLQVEGDVSESNLEQIKVGQPCEIELDAIPDTRFRGVVHMIVPTADRTKATVMVKVRFVDKDTRILPEMSAKVAFLSREVKKEEMKPHLVLTRKSLRIRGDSKTVFLVQGDRVVETRVVMGPASGEMAEVLQGVKAGDKVVANPPDTLTNGAKVRLAQP